MQSGPSGRGTQFVDIKLKVPPQYFLGISNKPKLLLKCPQKVVLDQMDHPVEPWIVNLTRLRQERCSRHLKEKQQIMHLQLAILE